MLVDFLHQFITDKLPEIEIKNRLNFWLQDNIQ